MSNTTPDTTPSLPTADLTGAPLPTQKTLRQRRSLPFQLGRFAVFNLRIMRIVAKGHGE